MAHKLSTSSVRLWTSSMASLKLAHTVDPLNSGPGSLCGHVMQSLYHIKNRLYIDFIHNMLYKINPNPQLTYTPNYPDYGIILSNNMWPFSHLFFYCKWSTSQQIYPVMYGMFPSTIHTRLSLTPITLVAFALSGAIRQLVFLLFYYGRERVILGLFGSIQPYTRSFPPHTIFYYHSTNRNGIANWFLCLYCFFVIYVFNGTCGNFFSKIDLT